MNAKHYEAHQAPTFRPKPTPYVHCHETIQGWTRVELPEMTREEWEEVKVWIAEEGMIHRVHGSPKSALKQLSQPMGQLPHEALVEALIKMALDLGANPDEPLAVSFKDEKAAIFFKMRWVG